MVNVVIGIIEKDNRILLIKRERGDFINMWGLPGGKVEECEHIDHAIEREIREELGLQTKFQTLLGISTEIMHDKNSTSFLYVCHLKLISSKIKNPEFETHWFDIEEIKNLHSMIESDKIFLREFYIQKNLNYLKLDCFREENGKYFWK